MTQEEINRAAELFESYRAAMKNGEFSSAIEINESMENECPISGLTYLTSAKLYALFYFRSAENPIDFESLENNLDYFESKPDGYFENDFVKSRSIAGLDNIAYVLYVHDDEKLLALNNQNDTALRDAVRFSEFNLGRATMLLNEAEKKEQTELITEISELIERLKSLSLRMDAVKKKLDVIKEHITELNAQKRADKTEADRKKNKTARIIRYVLGAVIVVAVIVSLLIKR